jgi:hypothetical protein
MLALYLQTIRTSIELRATSNRSHIRPGYAIRPSDQGKRTLQSAATCNCKIQRDTELLSAFFYYGRIRRLQRSCSWFWTKNFRDPETPAASMRKDKILPVETAISLHTAEVELFRSSPSERTQFRGQDSTHPKGQTALRSHCPHSLPGLFAEHRCKRCRSCTGPTSLPVR